MADSPRRPGRRELHAIDGLATYTAQFKEQLLCTVSNLMTCLVEGGGSRLPDLHRLPSWRDRRKVSRRVHPSLHQLSILLP